MGCKMFCSCCLSHGGSQTVDGILNIDEELCNTWLLHWKMSFAIEEENKDIKLPLAADGGKNRGESLNKLFTDEEELLGVIEKAILLYREQGMTGERFADTIARLGFANVEAQLLADEILDRKQEILEANLHMVGGATC